MKLQVTATEDAIASTAMSLTNSCFEGNKLWGGSILDIVLDERGELDKLVSVVLEHGLGSFFDVEDMDFIRLRFPSVFAGARAHKGKKKVLVFSTELVVGEVMADLPGYMRACLHTGKLAFLAILVSGGIVLQILACALYNNWWPMLTVIMYVILPMPLLFFVGSDSSSLLTESNSGWVNATKFLTGASAIGSIAIPVILKHAGAIGWGALAMELSSFFVFVIAIVFYIGTSDEDDYSIL
ncbi:unnamed protein product [Dovyalis caffra]|uniref:Uncharacterized protein n=1 Tax=Dovyalis caffra TaxID=77055 RepID=A0AAV1SR82_9ROSI|nr:unnamed protein product [Dovyalis caffra]